MIQLKLTRTLYSATMADLLTPHAFAAERIGFILTRRGTLSGQDLILAATRYIRIADHNYVDDPAVGARIGSAAIRDVMQQAMDSQEGVLHVHVHEHHGAPAFSGTDLRELGKLIPSFQHVVPNSFHGALVFSEDDAHVRLLVPAGLWISRGITISIVGWPLTYYEQRR